MFAGSGLVTHTGFLRKWSEHHWRAGFRHRDYIASLADENGNIHISKLPEQEIFFREAFRGPHHQYNNAARWVTKDELEPEPYAVPDIREMTAQEQHALLYQFEQLGMIPPTPTPPPLSEVIEQEPDERLE